MLPALTLQGLDEKATYSVALFDGKARPRVAPLPARLSGAYLMKHGINLPLAGDYDATSIKLERIAE